MSVFDLTFLLVALAAIATLAGVLLMAAAGQVARAGRVLRRLLVCAAVYMLVVIGVSPLPGRRVVQRGTARCFDDWCIAVTGGQQQGAVYQVGVTVSSVAKRAVRRERGVEVLLEDASGRRYEPVGALSRGALDAELAPGGTARAVRAFQLPAGTRPVGAVVTHSGGFPIRWFVIGEEAWFHKPALMEL
jgi:hypothetical protein